jgi:CDP-4-dehydro-6-deoxyglucose reductase/ferredoxin-NAD(P)+ reductase (naphthalene dioxygenase ferredoxin-specific)
LGCTIDASPDKPLLDALLDGGVDYPHGCATGLCSLCKSRIVSGRVLQLEDYYPSALSDEERSAGLFLPCCALAQGNCVISPVQQDAMMPAVQILPGIVTEAALMTHDIVRIRITPDNGRKLEFLPGQYVEVAFGSHPARDFSLAGIPGEASIELFVRRLRDGRVTANLDPGRLVGTSARIRGPFGTAYLRENHVGPMIAVAGGSGLAPVRSIVHAALDRGMRGQIRVYLGVRTERDVFLEDEFRALCALHPGLSFDVVLSDEMAPGALRRVGMVHEAIQEDLDGLNLREHMTYVAGPPPMVDAVSSVLSGLGMPAANCHVDPFLTHADRARLRGAA